MAKTPDYLKPSAFARELGVTTATVHGWIRAGRLPAAKLPGGHYLILRSEVARILRPADTQHADEKGE